MSEIKPIPSFDGYYASSCGKIYKNNKELSQSLGGYKRNYLRVSINRDKQYVQRLVLMAFDGLPRDGYEACHNDGDSLNNNIKNLRWDTRLSNARDKIKHGTSGVGEQNAMARLSDKQAALVTKLNVFIKTADLAKTFNVSRSTVRLISTGKSRYKSELNVFYNSNLLNGSKQTKGYVCLI